MTTPTVRYGGAVVTAYLYRVREGPHPPDTPQWQFDLDGVDTGQLTYLAGGGRYVVTAGNAGSDRHPAWYYNLAADPGVIVEAGNETFEAVAVIAEEAERAALYERFAVAYPQLDCYQERTTRQIPVVILTRR
jgi:deazaflavin-dependent oxidoreductase (nitroreductase family)